MCTRLDLNMYVLLIPESHTTNGMSLAILVYEFDEVE